MPPQRPHVAEQFDHVRESRRKTLVSARSIDVGFAVLQRQNFLATEPASAHLAADDTHRGQAPTSAGEAHAEIVTARTIDSAHQRSVREEAATAEALVGSAPAHSSAGQHIAEPVKAGSLTEAATIPRPLDGFNAHAPPAQSSIYTEFRVPRKGHAVADPATESKLLLLLTAFAPYGVPIAALEQSFQKLFWEVLPVPAEYFAEVEGHKEELLAGGDARVRTRGHVTKLLVLFHVDFSVFATRHRCVCDARHQSEFLTINVSAAPRNGQHFACRGQLCKYVCVKM